MLTQVFNKLAAVSFINYREFEQLMSHTPTERNGAQVLQVTHAGTH